MEVASIVMWGTSMAHQGCTKHPWNPNADCLACQVKAINRRQGEANELSLRQGAEANALAAEQAEAAYATLASQRRTEQMTANAHLAMWRQSADGQVWERWASRAQPWIDAARLPDRETAYEWREEARAAQGEKPVRFTEKVGCFFGSLSAVAFLVAIVSKIASWIVATHFFGDVAVYALEVALVLAVPCGLSLFFTREVPDVTPADFKERYGDPLADLDGVASWREGLTRADNAAQISAIEALAYPGAGVFPRPGQLPDLPRLEARDPDTLPPLVAEKLRQLLDL